MGGDHKVVPSGIVRSQGQTTSERYLKQLCDKTFLSLWSYPGIYRDQGGGGAKSRREGKEVCDLLVIFDKHIIIFSDKHCKFEKNGDVEVNWRRWFRRTVKESAKQVLGAERWIRSFPSRLFLDRACTKPFPISIPDARTAIIHRIVVAHGISEACCDVFGGTGSLALSSELVGEAQHNAPFTIGWPTERSKGFVHVLDDTTLDFVLRTVDTVTDFIWYLTKKEALFQSGRKIVVAGEENLLAWYLSNANQHEEHDFLIPDNIDGIAVDETHWFSFAKHPQRQAQLDANKISYAWDRLIEKFSRNVMRATEYFPSDLGTADKERVLRFMAREFRTRRRLLANALLEKMHETPASERAARVVEPSYPGDPYYVFVLLPWPSGMSEHQYRNSRLNLLTAYCRAVHVKYPSARHIVGIATESGIGAAAGRSEDVIYYDASQWDAEKYADVESIRIKLGLLDRTNKTSGCIEEYPKTTDREFRAPPTSRNSPCPCGSRKRYKRCCGRVARTSAVV